MIPMTSFRPGRAEFLVRWAVPLAVLAFFAATVSGYGVFRDELYYMACARHLDWGYVDHPPLVALIARLAGITFPDSWIALRMLSALAAAGTVLLAGDLARELGGGRFARVFAQALTASAPIYLSLFSIYSMNGFDVLIWAGLAVIAARILAGGNPKLWIAFGTLAGIGLANKIDVALLGAGIVGGCVIARRLDVFRSRWIWFGGVLAAALFAPHVVWQAFHGWPTREFVANAQRGKINPLGPLGFVASQLGMVGPVALGFALAGMGWLLAGKQARAFRPLGWAGLSVLVVLAVSVSKPYYFAPAFTLLFAASAVALEIWTLGRLARPGRAIAFVAAASIVVAAPLAKPLLSEDAYVRYAAALHVRPGTDENHRLGRLPQFFADMHGWRELVEAVAAVHAALPADDRVQACIYARNYGEAGAVDHFGPALGLPSAISQHNNYWMWGPGSCTGAVILIIGGELADHIDEFASVESAAVFRCTDCMPYESDLTIWVARGLKAPIADAWRAGKHYD
jgi:hypothetical protein